ncbi:ANTAR domain-containing protein, partial [Kineococcus sp. T13]|uniref:ANTAR domain-containing protein n=1 Tax=Kineococcus vitellinus TaxID=2696565 RepID=UPI001412A73C
PLPHPWTFSVDVGAGRWRWSAPREREPGAALPTTGEEVAARGPAGRRLLQAVEQCAADGGPFTLSLRTDEGGRPAWWLVHGGPGGPGEVTGSVVDTTAAVEHAVSERTTEQVRTALAGREGIDQAKGMLMLVYGIDADAAFGLLRWYSQHSQVKLAELAARLTAAAADSTFAGGTQARAAVDDLLSSVLGDAAPPVPTGGGAALRTRRREPAVPGAPWELHVEGELDLATALDFADALADVESRARPGDQVVVDLTAVEYLGSAGMTVLVGADRRGRRRGTPLRVVLGRSTTVLDFPGLRELTVVQPEQHEQHAGRVAGRAGG